MRRHCRELARVASMGAGAVGDTSHEDDDVARMASMAMRFVRLSADLGSARRLGGALDDLVTLVQSAPGVLRKGSRGSGWTPGGVHRGPGVVGAMVRGARGVRGVGGGPSRGSGGVGGVQGVGLDPRGAPPWTRVMWEL